jgi:hypothetical protein
LELLVIDNTVVPNPDAVSRIVTLHFDNAVWTRILGQSLNIFLNPIAQILI